MASISDLNFPVIYFNKYTFYVEPDANKLTVTTKAGIKNKLYENLTIIDSSGKLYKVKSARKLHGVGPLWGYNIFLNQKIKVELDFSPTVKEASIEELKKMVFKNFEKDRHFWESRDDLSELKEMVSSTESMSSLIHKLGEALNVQYKV